MTDERRNAPSASGMPRYAACPASFAMEQLARERNALPPSGADAAHGDSVHGELHVPGSVGLTMSAADMAERCARHRMQVIDEWTPDSPPPDEAPLQVHEMRLGLTPLGTVIEMKPETKSRIIFSGRFDGAVIDDGNARGIVWDFKSLMGEHEKAMGNLQLLSLAVLVARRWSLDSVRVALIQPWRGQPSVADFDKDALAAAFDYLKRQLTFLTAERAINDTHAGPQCRYCPGRLVCPEINGERLAAIECIAPHTMPAEGGSKAAFARVAEFSGEDLAAILDDPRFKMAAWIMEAAKALAAKRLADGQPVPGYELREVEGKRTVSDPRAAYEALGTLKPEEFFSACSVSLPKLEEIVRVNSGQKVNKDGSMSAARYNLSGVQAKALVNEKCATVIIRKKSMRLAKIGAELEDSSND